MKRQNYDNTIVIRPQRYIDPTGSYSALRYKSSRHICDNHSLKMCSKGAMVTCIGKDLM